MKDIEKKPNPFLYILFFLFLQSCCYGPPIFPQSDEKKNLQVAFFKILIINVLRKRIPNQTIILKSYESEKKTPDMPLLFNNSASLWSIFLHKMVYEWWFHHVAIVTMKHLMRSLLSSTKYCGFVIIAQK